MSQVFTGFLISCMDFTKDVLPVGASLWERKNNKKKSLKTVNKDNGKRGGGGSNRMVLRNWPSNS